MNIAIIPARGGSKRIPRKNLAEFCGKPLIYWTIKQALESTSVNRVCVSTDDVDIMNTAIKYDAEIIRRPIELAKDNSTLEEVLLHAVDKIKAKDDDLIVSLQPTSPLRLPDDIDNCIKRRAISVNSEDDLFLWDSNYYSITFNDNPRVLNGKYYRENGSIYCVFVDDLKTYKSRYASNTGAAMEFHIMQKWQSFEIDSSEDIEICEYFMREKVL